MRDLSCSYQQNSEFHNPNRTIEMTIGDISTYHYLDSFETDNGGLTHYTDLFMSVSFVGNKPFSEFTYKIGESS